MTLRLAIHSLPEAGSLKIPVSALLSEATD